MDLAKLIGKLRQERVKLDEVIASLERMQRVIAEAKAKIPRKRGRKSMDEQARKEVSERMKRYWAFRRSQLNPPGPPPPPAG